MIVPAGYSPEWTDEQVVEGYIAQGKTRENAELRMRILRYRKPGQIVR